MTRASFVLVLSSVTLSAIAQVALKFGVSQPHFADAFASQKLSRALGASLTSPAIVGGFGLYALGAALWLFVLAKLDLSAAYPFVGLGFIFTMVLSIQFFGEQVSLARMLGTLLIVLGCALVARSV
jgi:multidrug transporter EmrE-like cation transporter